MIESLLTHRVSLVRRVTLLDGDKPLLDEDGHLQSTESRTPGIAAAIQPLTTRERAAQHQAGATVSTHRIYMVGQRVASPDVVAHDPTACPMSPDLPDVSYEINGVQDAAGLGHHLEIDATEIGPTLPIAPPSGAGGSGGSGGTGS